MPDDQEALDFEGFFRAEYDRLFRTMWLMSGSRAEGKDLAQEAMARAYERWDRVRAAQDPTAYLYKIALNLHRRRLRRALRRREAVPLPKADPALEAATRIDVLRAVSGLPRRQREALLLVEWVGLSSAEAADVLKIAPESVRVRVHRARAALRSCLGGVR
jgi:RNA polymerase sigma factor (sigma-70 family)